MRTYPSAHSPVQRPMRVGGDCQHDGIAGAGVAAGDVDAPQPLEGMAEAEGLGPAACAAAGALDALFADQVAHSAEGAQPAASHPPGVT